MADPGPRLALEVRGDVVLSSLKDIPKGKRDLAVKVANSLEREARIIAKPHSEDTGEVARSIETEIMPPGRDILATVFSDHPAMQTLEFGRSPGARMPPIGPIRDWARRHGIAIEPFVLARSIARKGTEALAPFGKAGQKTKTKLRSIIRDVEKKIVSRWP